MAERKFPNFFEFLSRTSSRILLRIFPEIFKGIFVLRFPGNGNQKKNHQNPRPFSMQNSLANTNKNIHKMFLESRQSNLAQACFLHDSCHRHHDNSLQNDHDYLDCNYVARASPGLVDNFANSTPLLRKLHGSKIMVVYLHCGLCV